jgi:outer membrane biosynthesis protein TonB
MKMRHAAALPREGLAAGAIGTAAVHVGAALVLIVGLGRSARSSQLVYSVDLVAAPRPTAASRAAPAPVATPPAPPTVAPKPKIEPKKTAPVAKPKTPPKVDPKAEPTPAKASSAPLAPGATPGTGTDVDNVKVQGAQFPFPDYLNRLANEILRRWARPLGTASLEAEVSFTIMRDGSVRNIRMVRSSRSYSFDLGAQGAVEQAAEDRAFGPLPSGWQSDILQVAFLFTPRNK